MIAVCLALGVYRVCLLGKDVADAAANMIKSLCVDKIMYYVVVLLTGGSAAIFRERAKGLTQMNAYLRKQIEGMNPIHTSSNLDKNGHSTED